MWMNGRYVGAWEQIRGGRDRFTYDKDWMSDSQGRALSLSLPMTADAAITSAAVGYYFDNLLPDSQAIRERIQIDGERRLSGHAERARVDEHIRSSQLRSQISPGRRLGHTAKMGRERLGPALRPVDHHDPFEAARLKRINDCPSRAAAGIWAATWR